MGVFVAWIDIARSFSMEVYTPTSNKQECPYPRQQNVLIKPFDLCQSDSWKENYISVAFTFNVKFDKF